VGLLWNNSKGNSFQTKRICAMNLGTASSEGMNLLSEMNLLMEMNLVKPYKTKRIYGMNLVNKLSEAFALPDLSGRC